VYGHDFHTRAEHLFLRCLQHLSFVNSSFVIGINLVNEAIAELEALVDYLKEIIALLEKKDAEK
jgi:hypothetical protein